MCPGFYYICLSFPRLELPVTPTLDAAGVLLASAAECDSARSARHVHPPFSRGSSLVLNPVMTSSEMEGDKQGTPRISSFERHRRLVDASHPQVAQLSRPTSVSTVAIQRSTATDNAYVWPAVRDRRLGITSYAQVVVGTAVSTPSTRYQVQPQATYNTGERSSWRTQVAGGEFPTLPHCQLWGKPNSSRTQDQESRLSVTSWTGARITG